MSILNLNGMMRLVRAITGITKPINESPLVLPINRDVRNDAARNERLQRTATLGMPANVPNKRIPDPAKIMKLRARPIQSKE